MHRVLKFVLLLTLLAPTLGFSGITDPDITLEDIGAIRVRLLDQASGGCWTNIKEVKNYAEDKLEMAGADLSDFDNTDELAGLNTNFEIMVSGWRLKSGLCVGYGRISFNGFSSSPLNLGMLGMLGMLYFSNYTVQLQNPKNSNYQILNIVQGAIAEWEERN